MKDIRPQHRSGTASVCRPSTAPPQTAAPGGQCGVCAHTDSHTNRSLCPMTAQPTRYRRGPPPLSALNAAQGRRWGTEPSGRGFSLPTKLPALRTQSSPRGSNSPGAALHCIALHRTCLAEGVIPCCTTISARVMFSSCMRWQYILMVLMPTLGSSEGGAEPGEAEPGGTPGPTPPRPPPPSRSRRSPGKKTNIWSVGSSLCATNTVRSVRRGRPSLGLSPNCALNSSSV